MSDMREIDPKQTKRAAATIWMQAPMPMVTLFKTLDVTNLVRQSRKHRESFNLLLCWCIGQAAAQMEDFYLLPVENRLMQFDQLAVNIVVANRDGGINTCDIPVSETFGQFRRDYLELTRNVHDRCENFDLGEDYMVIGTSAITGCEIDGAVNIYAGFYNNPFLTWGKYRKRWRKATLPVSFQFHHTQMDGGEAGEFLNRLQAVMNELRI